MEIKKHIQNFKQQPHLTVVKTDIMAEVELKLFDTIASAIDKCVRDMNANITHDQQEYLVNELTDIFLKKHPTIEFEQDIPAAFNNGIRNKYGKYFGFSVITFENFLVAWLESDERKRKLQVKAQADKIIALRNEPSPDQRFDTAKNLVLQSAAALTTGKYIERTAIVNYDFLTGLILIDFTRAEKEQFMAEALHVKVPQDLEHEMINSRDNWQRLRTSAEISSFRMSVEKKLPFTEGQKIIIKHACKKIAFKAFIQDVIINEINLEQLIEAKREFYKLLINHNDAKG